MSGQVAVRSATPRIGRSIGALFAGFVVNVVLSVATDLALHAFGVLPALGQEPMNNSQCGLATAYRTVYGVFSSYVVARLAPYRPMQHALFGAGIGMVLATGGAVATWNKGLGPHWYSIVLILLALPCGWAGGMLRLRQMQSE